MTAKILSREAGDTALKTTPMLDQYMDVKARYPDAVVFFRMGDFYEMFFEDAELASRILEITLTSRDRNKEEKIPMCGVPVHAAEGYLVRLVQSGHRVAVCEQVEDAKTAKGLLQREVVRVVTPGLLVADGGLTAKTNNFLLALRPAGGKGPWGLACLDLSTGEFRVTELAREEDALRELFRLEPSEVLLPEEEPQDGLSRRINQTLPEVFFTRRPLEYFGTRRAEAYLREHFNTLSLDGFGLRDLRAGTGAAGSLLAYVLETQNCSASHIKPPRPYHLDRHLIIDEATKRNLELVANSLDRGRNGTLLGVLDFTHTPMGGRLLRQWLLYPLRELDSIRDRLTAVEALKEHGRSREGVFKGLRQVYDLERLLARTVLGTANGRDLLALRHSLARVPEIRQAVEGLAGLSGLLHEIFAGMDLLEDIRTLVDAAIREDCPVQLREGGLIKEGFNSELDELMRIQRNGRSFLAEIEAAERTRTGIASLKVGYNRVFGYYIEVSKAQAAKVPENYLRKQTLVGAERYITPELKEIESRILTAQERRMSLEYELFHRVRQDVAGAGGRIQATASALAVLDCLASLAEAAERNRYIRPEVNEGDRIVVLQGRHPVVELSMEPGAFVPNNIELDHQGSLLQIITGPNMAGKSTVLRQTALIVLMAQTGSFVPADRAEIGIVDQIFTRVGATDYLSRGQSTFMVEMSETANILHNATGRSLVVLDEIGRGTSTYDGLAIAWAVAEHLLHKDRTGVKTLFATHYHELTELAEKQEKVRNLHVAVREWEDRIVFLRRLLEGATNRSYGIQVAALAGVPGPVIERAKNILERIEQRPAAVRALAPAEPVRRKGPRRRAAQLVLPLVVDQGTELRDRILSIDVNGMTPLEALNLLASLRSLAERQ